MKKLLMTLALVACALLCCTAAQAQVQNKCLVCRANFCSWNDIGGCACTVTIGGGCAQCGICVAGHCSQGCLSPNKQDVDRDDRTSMTPNKNAITPAQLAAHPWLEDHAFTEQLSKYSPEMAQLVQSEQSILKSSFCTGFRRGSGVLKPGNDSTGYRWELITRPDVDEYRLKRDADGTEVRLLLSGTEWTLFSGEYIELLGKGNIEIK